MTFNRARRLAQVGGLLLIFAVPLLNKRGVTFISGTLYSLAVGPVWMTDPAVGLQTVLTTGGLDLKLLLSLLIPILLALVFGKAFCSWICPQNALSELGDAAAAKMGVRRRFAPAPASPAPRLAVLAALLLLMLLLKLPLISLLSAPGTISVQAAKLVYEGTLGVEAGLIAAILLAEFFLLRRGWCNFLCPVGTFLGLLRLPRTMKVVFSEKDGRPCGRCQACAAACGLGLDPVAGRIYPQCHNCGACLERCDQITAARPPLRFRF